MRLRALLSGVLLLGLLVGAGACRKTIVNPIYRRPVISSVVAFPTVLGPGDSTMITVTASDPDGDALAYIWEPYNGLNIKDGGPFPHYYYTTSPSMVFYRTTTGSSNIDTASVYCSVSDGRGGIVSRRVLVFYRN